MGRQNTLETGSTPLTAREPALEGRLPKGGGQVEFSYTNEVTGALYIGLFAIIGAGIVYATLAIAKLAFFYAGSTRYGTSKAKDDVYECGEETIGDTNVQFNLNYYLFAMLFVVFDVEAALLFSWSVAFDALGWSGLVTAMTFLIILTVGWLYALRKGALKWVY
jgi:NADH-quinone oxidoreductase subunit A